MQEKNYGRELAASPGQPSTEFARKLWGGTNFETVCDMRGIIDFYLFNDNFSTGVSLITAILSCHDEMI